MNKPPFKVGDEVCATDLKNSNLEGLDLASTYVVEAVEFQDLPGSEPDTEGLVEEPVQYWTVDLREMGGYQTFGGVLAECLRLV